MIVVHLTGLLSLFLVKFHNSQRNCFALLFLSSSVQENYLIKFFGGIFLKKIRTSSKKL